MGNNAKNTLFFSYFCKFAKRNIFKTTYATQEARKATN